MTNVNSGKRLEVASAGTSDGATVQQYADTGHATQDWHIIDNGDGTYRIENANQRWTLDLV
ncbi:RICIN domain-containing protein [Halostagnicola larsenii]|uniref:RICIN domain-containing protein n=1 Tax=Halostagnicola larsenii TaxID=353800 RepID=UPI00373FDB39